MSGERPPLLLLVHRIPFPPNKGDKVRSYRILRYLAERYRVFLGTFIDHPDDWQHVSVLERWCEARCVRPLDPRWARVGSLRGILTGEALSVPYYRDATMAKWVGEVVSAQAIRRAVVFSGPMAQYVQGIQLDRCVLDFCDLDSEKWLQYAATKGWPLGLLYAREGRRLLEFEVAAAKRSNASLFVTLSEAKLFMARAPEVAEKVQVMENGVDTDFFSPEHAGENPYRHSSPIIAFTGAMDYWPNVDAMCWFVRDILPRCRQAFPEMQLWIVGMNPSAEIRALAQAGAVEVTGSVADIRPFLAHADAIVAPLRIARGIQNKVLEGMAMARPVVAHPACLNGLDARVGEEILAASGPSEFVSALELALSPVGDRIGSAARRRVQARYSWAGQLDHLGDLLESNLAIGGAV